MEEIQTKEIRLDILLKVLHDTAMFSNNQKLLNWIEVKRRESVNADINKKNELLSELDNFFTSNYDVIQLFQISQNKCNAKQIKEPLEVTCRNC
jgi:hypothetical protein